MNTVLGIGIAAIGILFIYMLGKINVTERRVEHLEMIIEDLIVRVSVLFSEKKEK